jgi:hypothetical protein
VNPLEFSFAMCEQAWTNIKSQQRFLLTTAETKAPAEFIRLKNLLLSMLGY